MGLCKMDRKYFSGVNIHKNKNKFYELKKSFHEGNPGTVNESGLGINLDEFIETLITLRNNGFKNIHFGSDDPYCGVEISVSKLEKE